MRAVKQAHSAPFTSSGYFVALMLVLFSTTGLLAGVLTRDVASALRSSGPPSAVIPPADLTATAGACVPPPQSHFTLQVKVTPSTVREGQTLQVDATALAVTCTSPLAGVSCSLVQTTDSLVLSPWPDPVITDASGHAQWSIPIPPGTTAGSYTLTLRGDGPTGYEYTWRQKLTITA